MIGETFSHFEAVELLGKGGFGEVYKARDHLLDRWVALKVLPESVAGDREKRLRFRREARTASSLNHPNICTIYQFGDAGGRPFIAMELVEGVSLRSHIGGKPLPTAEVLDITIQIADALAEAGDHGVVHRDLKSRNVLLTSEGQVKILDFGLAKQLLMGTEVGEDSQTPSLDITGEGSLVGTVRYMSPEQLRAEPVDHRSDLFSFGILCCEMITGKPPFKDRSLFEASSAILNVTPDSFPQLAQLAPPALTRIVLRMLARRPEDRWASAAEILTALKRARLEILSLDSPAVSTVTGSQLLEPALLKSPPSIAVLPFENLSDDPQNEFLSDGLAEELTNALARLPGLKVAARTSAFAFKGRSVNVREIGAALGVSHVLAGSVRKAENRIRVTAQMASVVDGFELWSESFDRRVEDVFEIQDELAHTIAETLKVRLLDKRDRPLAAPVTEDVEAYDLYLRGRYHWNRRWVGGLQKGIEFFQRAIERDPDFAPPYAGLADSFNLIAFYNYHPPQHTVPRARQAAERALELDSRLAEAHASLAYLVGFFDWHWEAADRGFREALELSPSHATTHMWYAVFLMAVGRQEASAEHSRRARELDPLSAPLSTIEAYLSYYQRQPERGIEAARKALALDPAFRAAHIQLGLNYAQMERFDEARTAWETVLNLMPGLAYAEAMVAYCEAAAGDRKRATARRDRLVEEASSRYITPYAMSLLSVGVDDVDGAFDWLRRARDERNNFLVFLRLEPIFDAIRDDPRFDELVTAVGLP